MRRHGTVLLLAVLLACFSHSADAAGAALPNRPALARAATNALNSRAPSSRPGAAAAGDDTLASARTPSIAGGPAISATLRDQVVPDSDNDGAASPGDTIRYRAQVSNSGTNANDVGFQLTPDANTTLVGSSLNVSPIAFDDQYSTAGNTLLEVGVPAGPAPAIRVTGSVLGNDVEFLGDPFTLSAFDATSANGGAVTMNGDGTFTYLPAAGFSGSDAFTYTIADGAGLTSTATVSVEVLGRIWYVDKAAAAGGDGRSVSPLDALTAVNGAGGAGDADSPGDVLFLYSAATAYTGGIVLENNQQLIGQGVALTVSLGGPAITLVAASTRPTLGHSGATTVALAAGNTVRGLDVTSSGGAGIAGGAGGALTMNTLSVTSTNGLALNLAGAALAVTLSSVTVNNASGGGVLLSTNTGSITFQSLSITNTGGTGFSATNSGTVTVTGSANQILTTTGTALSLSGTTIGASGFTLRRLTSSGGSNGIALASTGALAGLTITGDGTAGSGGAITSAAGDAISLSSVRSLSITDFQVTGGGGNHLDAATMTHGVSLTRLFADQSASDGVRLINVLGPSSITGSTIQRSGGINLHVQSSSATAAAPGAPDILTIAGSTFTNTLASPSGNSGIRFEGLTGANMRLVLGTSTVTNNRVDGLEVKAQNNSRVDIRVTGTSFSGNLGSAINLSGANTATAIADVRNLTGVTSALNAINFIGFDTSVINATVDNVQITGSSTGSGIRAIQEGNGTVVAQLSGNNISGIAQAHGIVAQARAGTGSMSLTVTGNTVNNTASGVLALEGMNFESGSSAGGDANTICLNLANNNSTVSAISAQEGYRLRQRTGTTFHLQNFAGNGAIAGDVTAWVNTTKGNSGTTQILVGTAFSNAPANCATPPALPALVVEPIASEAAASPDDDGAASGDGTIVLGASTLDAPGAIPGSRRGAVIPEGIIIGVDVAIGTLPTNRTVTIDFDVTLHDPLTVAATHVTVQGLVSGTDFTSVPTDDPDVAGALDPTATVINAYPPSASATASDVTTAGGTSHAITVVYTDDVGIDTATFGDADLEVTGPGGPLGVTYVTFTGSGTSVTATYTLTPPGGSWDDGDNGAYTIAMVASQVLDSEVHAHAVPAGTIGSFSVNAPPPHDVGVSQLLAPVSGCSPTNAEVVTIRIRNFTANAETGFDVSFEVTGPAASSATENVGSLVVPANGTVDYTFTATADLSSTGDYTIAAKTHLTGDIDSANDGVAPTVTHYALPTVDAGADRVVTVGVPETLGGSPTASGTTEPYTYSWTPTTGLDDPGAANPVATPTGAILYTVEVTDGHGCKNTDTVTLSTATPTASATASDVSVGGGTSHTITVVYTDDVGVDTATLGNADLQITGPGGPIGVTFGGFTGGGASVTATYTMTPPGGGWNTADNGAYTIAMVANQVLDTDSQPVPDGAVGSFTVNIPAPDAGIEALLSPASACALTGSEAVTVRIRNFTATPATGFDVSFQVTGPAASSATESVGSLVVPGNGTANYTFTATANLAPTGSYSITVQTSLPDDADQLNDELSATVSHWALPTVSAGADRIVTPGVPVTLGGSPTASGTTTPYSYSWSPTSGLDDPLAANPVATPTGPITYTLEVTDGNGCRNTDAVTLSTAAAATIESRVARGSDDAEESASGSVDLGSSDLELVDDGDLQTVGLRFTNLAIPRGAVIEHAWIQFQADESQSETTPLQIRGHQVANAPAFTTASRNLSSRARTSAFVDWSPLAWTSGQAGERQRTLDLSAIVGEIVNGSGWASGNAIAFLITGAGHRTAESYEGTAAGAPLLHVEFSSASDFNRAPVVDAGPNQTVTLPAGALLDGTVSDDGLPGSPGVVTVTWSAVGPGSVTFADEHAVDTQASFGVAGTYLLRLTAFDGAMTARDSVTIEVLPSGSVATVERRIAASSDDAEESASGSVSRTSGDLELVYDGSLQTVGMRFTNLSIPRGASVSRAWVEFRARESQSGATVLTIHGEAADNAATFTGTTRNLSSRLRGASASWTPGPWTSGATYRTEELAPVIGDIVSRAGWQTGNALALIVTGTGRRTAYSFDGLASAAPLLHVEFTTGGVPANLPPVVDAGPAPTVTMPATPPATAALDGTASDDGIPTPAAPQVTWSLVSGPGPVGFADEHAVDTHASFGSAGVYVLRLTATDGLLSASDTTHVVVLPAGTVSTFEARIAAGSDDAEEDAAGSVDLSSSDLELVEDGSLQTVGLRFRNVAVPRGATITAAWVQFQADESQSEATRLVIQAQAADNAAAFGTSSRNLSMRPRTVETVEWQPDAWAYPAAGSAQRTVDLSVLIDEIVNRAGWTSGNALALIITGAGHRTAESFEGLAGAAPLLHLEYRTPSALLMPGAEPMAARTAAPIQTSARVVPVPLRGTGRIELALGHAGAVRVDLFDVQGRRIRTLLDERLAAGEHQVPLGPGLGAGLYFYRVQAPDRVLNGRVLVAR